MKHIANAAEITKLTEQNESFRGSNPNFEKMRAYQALKSELSSLLQHSPNFFRMVELPPSRNQRSAVITLEFRTVVLLLDDLFPLFRQAISLCDGFSVSCAGPHPSMSFTIMNIWED